MQPEEIKALALRLNGDQSPRVWSLLVTVFGELAQDADARIDGTRINDILSPMGIKPEAIRVALHRLRKEGWIDSIKTGRKSQYMLTKRGRRESAAASTRIYATEPLANEAWLVLFPPQSRPKSISSHSVWITPEVLLTDAPPKRADRFATRLSTDTPLPVWMSQKLCSPETATQSKILAEELGRLLPNLADGAGMTDAATCALRVLAVHSWRRIALRVPSLPDALFQPPWAGKECRTRLARLRLILTENAGA